MLLNRTGELSYNTGYLALVQLREVMTNTRREFFRVKSHLEA